MKFVHPEFLWAFAALSIPILIHLFNFRKYKTIYFSSLQFVQHIEKQTKSTQKLKNLIVLITRLLAYSMLILAFAQPYFPTSEGFVRAEHPAVAIHIDNSFSMTMQGVEGELISEAKEAARKIIKSLPRDTRILLSTNELDGIESRVTTPALALDRIDNISATPDIQTYQDVLDWQKTMLNNSDYTIQSDSKLIFISDFQKRISTFKGSKLDSTSQLFPIIIQPQSKTNLYIDTVWFESPIRKVNTQNQLTIGIANSGDQLIENAEVHIEIGSYKKDLFVTLKPNQTNYTTINYTDKSPGLKSGKIHLNENQYYADNDYYISYEIKEKSSVLIINGEDENNSIGKILSLDNYYDVLETNQNQFTREKLKEVNFVILNGCKEINSGLLNNLTEFAQSGGSVAVFPAKEIDYNSYNTFLTSFNLPVFSKSINQKTRITQLNLDDSFFTGVFKKKEKNPNLPGVTKLYSTIATSGSNYINLIQLQNGLPLLMKGTGDYTIFLYSSVLSPDYGSFINDILYTTCILRMAEIGQKTQPISSFIGQQNSFRIYSLSETEQPIHLINDKTDIIPQLERKENSIVLNLDKGLPGIQLEAGIYKITNTDDLKQIALNYSREESVTSYLTEDQIKNELNTAGYRIVQPYIVQEGTSMANLDLEVKNGNWKIFIFLGLLFLIIEMIIIKFWKKQLV